MRNPWCLVMSLFLISASPAWAFWVKATEKQSAEYEDGKLNKQRGGAYEITYEVNEMTRAVNRTDLKYVGHDRVPTPFLSDTISYAFESDDPGGSASFSGVMLRAERKKSQRLITALGKPSTGTVEVLLLGDDFYQLVKSANGRFYISSGTVQPIDEPPTPSAVDRLMDDAP